MAEARKTSNVEALKAINSAYDKLHTIISHPGVTQLYPGTLLSLSNPHDGYYESSHQYVNREYYRINAEILRQQEQKIMLSKKKYDAIIVYGKSMQELINDVKTTVAQEHKSAFEGVSNALVEVQAQLEGVERSGNFDSYINYLPGIKNTATKLYQQIAGILAVNNYKATQANISSSEQEKLKSEEAQLNEIEARIEDRVRKIEEAYTKAIDELESASYLDVETWRARATVAEAHVASWQARATAAEAHAASWQARATAVEANLTTAQAATAAAEQRAKTAEANLTTAQAATAAAEQRAKTAEANLTAAQAATTAAEQGAQVAEAILTTAQAATTGAEQGAQAAEAKLTTAQAETAAAEQGAKTAEVQTMETTDKVTAPGPQPQQLAPTTPKTQLLTDLEDIIARGRLNLEEERFLQQQRRARSTQATTDGVSSLVLSGHTPATTSRSGSTDEQQRLSQNSPMV